MESSVLSFLKAEWKVSDTGLDHWASNLSTNVVHPVIYEISAFYLHVENTCTPTSFP